MVLLVQGFLTETVTKSASCFEMRDDYEWFGLKELTRTCWMRKNTTIDSLDVALNADRDEQVEGLTVFGNKKIYYLPENVSDVFPDLLMYGASEFA